MHCVRDNEILLISPRGNLDIVEDDLEVDRVMWGDGGGLNTTAGASLERTGFADGDGWVTGSAPWPGSAGDLGSPAQAYALPASTPTPTTESTAIPTPTEVITPTAAPTATDPPTSTLTPTPAATAGPPPDVFISEFLANPAAVADGDGECS